MSRYCNDNYSGYFGRDQRGSSVPEGKTKVPNLTIEHKNMTLDVKALLSNAILRKMRVVECTAFMATVHIFDLSDLETELLLEWLRMDPVSGEDLENE